MTDQNNRMENEELDLYFQKMISGGNTQLTGAPPELEARIRSAILAAANRQRKKRIWLIRAAVSAASVIIILSVFLVSPTLSSYARQWLSAKVPEEWKRLFVEHRGIEDATSHDYRPIPSVTVEKDGISITLENIYLEEEKLQFYASVSGAEEQKKAFLIVSGNFKKAGMRQNITTIKDEQGNPLQVMQVVQRLNAKEVRDFLRTNPDTLTFEVFQSPSSVNERQQHFTDIVVPFHASSFLESKRIRLDKEVAMEKAKIRLEQLTVSSTEMKLEFQKFAPEGFEVDIQQLGSEDNPYIIGSDGEIYSSNDLSLKNELTFHPSAFFKHGEEITLHLEKAWITDVNDSLEFDISLNDPESFPVTLQFRDRTISVIGARYESGHLYLDVEIAGSAEEPPPWKMEYERYQEKVNRDPELLQLYQKKYKVYSGQAYGRALPKINAEGEQVPGVHQVMMMAPEQEKYTLRVYRFEDPVAINQNIVIKVPEEP